MHIFNIQCNHAICHKILSEYHNVHRTLKLNVEMSKILEYADTTWRADDLITKINTVTTTRATFNTMFDVEKRNTLYEQICVEGCYNTFLLLDIVSKRKGDMNHTSRRKVRSTKRRIFSGKALKIQAWILRLIVYTYVAF